MNDLSMTADLGGKSVRIVGERNAIVEHIAARLAANGARMVEATGDILLVSYSLLPDTDFAATNLDTLAETMVEKGGGRIVILLSAMAFVPMRRHTEYSAGMAAAYTRMRGLAMRFGPKLLVNAVGCGLILDENDAVLSGDSHMATHLSVDYTGSAADISNAVLFLCDPLNSYTTGQILLVDGGWSPGYGRNF
jgi:hypothetical protein